MPKDHYVTLGVQPNATLAEIKSAYRQRALERHPDRTGAEGGPFREVQEAYQILSDPNSRRAYDRAKRGKAEVARERFHRIAEPLSSPMRRRAPIVSRPYSNALLDPLTAIGHTARIPESRIFNVRLPRRATRTGGQIRLQIPLNVPCPACAGFGGYLEFRCARCGGVGAVVIEAGVTVDYPPGIVSTHLVRVPVTLPSGGVAHVVVRLQVF